MGLDPHTPELGSEKFDRWWKVARPAIFAVVGICMILADWITGGPNLQGASGIGLMFCGFTAFRAIDIARKP